MYDRYIIAEDGFKNIASHNEATGFQLQLRLPYYRGLVLSMVEDIKVMIDGDAVTVKSLELHGNKYTLSDLEHVYNDRWEFGEKCIVSLVKPGGVESGEHNIEVSVAMRISYRPILLTGKDKKTLQLNNENSLLQA